MTYRGRVPGRYRFVAAPRWVLGHVIVLAIAVAMVLLGRWQLDVSNTKHFDLQNFGYALQWWAFTAFGLYMWWRIMRDHARASDPHQAPPAALEPAPVAYRRYLMPQSRDVVRRGDASSDVMLTAYNSYLAGLADGTDEETQ